MTAGLVEASAAISPLAPRSRSEQALLHSRALGVRTLWGFLVLGIILTTLQIIVAVGDGVWWAWMGAVLFRSITVHFGNQILRLRAAGVEVDSAMLRADTISVFWRTALVWGTYFERLRSPGQPESAQHGRFVMKWRRDADAGWRDGI